MDTARRIGWIAVLSFALSGCMVWNGAGSLFSGVTCPVIPVALDQAVWPDAEVLEVRVRQGRFEPMLLRMRQGLPYILRFTNADDQARIFNAPEFFSAVTVHKILIGPADIGETCVAAVAVPPQEVAEIQLVAERDGRYIFEDNAFIFPPVPGRAGIGLITIARDDQGRPGSLPGFGY